MGLWRSCFILQITTPFILNRPTAFLLEQVYFGLSLLKSISTLPIHYCLSLLLRLKAISDLVLSLLSICFLLLAWRLNLVLGPDFFEERIYYATDTRIDSILFGCVLAVAFNPVRFEGNNSDELRLKHWLAIISAVVCSHIHLYVS